jgi:hypothetical protein
MRITAPTITVVFTSWEDAEAEGDAMIVERAGVAVEDAVAEGIEDVDTTPIFGL